MNEIDERVIYNVREWLSHAEGDLEYAKIGLELKTKQSYRLVAFHAQQCAEKSLKAYLIYHKIDFPYTHNIATILALCKDISDWTDMLQDAQKLTLYASTLRYPGERIKVTKKDAIVAIEIASNVQKVVKKALVDEGLKLE